MLDQILQRIPQPRELFDLLIQLDDMLVRQCLYIRTGARSVLPQGQQLADFLQ
jgi:hypothetical protein